MLLTERTTWFNQKSAPGINQGLQHIVLDRPIEDSPSVTLPRHCAQHGHHCFVRIFAVRQGVIEADTDWLAIDLQVHCIGRYGEHASCGGGFHTPVVTGVRENGICVVVIHVGADASAHIRGEGVCRHGVGEMSRVFTSA